MKKEFSKKNKAFTLVEVMLYTTLLSVFLLSMSLFVNSVISAKAKNQIILDVERQGEYISSIIYESIINSTDINNPLPGQESSSLSLNTEVSINNPTVISINDNKIQIKEGSSPAIYLNSDNIKAENLLFKEHSFLNSPENISASFTLSAASVNNRTEFNYSQDFYINASRRY